MYLLVGAKSAASGPASGETCGRSLAPPLHGGPAALGSAVVSFSAHETYTSSRTGTLSAGMVRSLVPSLMVRVEKVWTPSMVSRRESTRL